MCCVLCVVSFVPVCRHKQGATCVKPSPPPPLGCLNKERQCTESTDASTALARGCIQCVTTSQQPCLQGAHTMGMGVGPQVPPPPPFTAAVFTAVVRERGEEANSCGNIHHPICVSYQGRCAACVDRIIIMSTPPVWCVPALAPTLLPKLPQPKCTHTYACTHAWCVCVL